MRRLTGGRRRITDDAAAPERSAAASSRQCRHGRVPIDRCHDGPGEVPFAAIISCRPRRQVPQCSEPRREISGEACRLAGGHLRAVVHRVAGSPVGSFSRGVVRHITGDCHRAVGRLCRRPDIGHNGRRLGRELRAAAVGLDPQCRLDRVRLGRAVRRPQPSGATVRLWHARRMRPDIQQRRHFGLVH